MEENNYKIKIIKKNIKYIKKYFEKYPGGLLITNRRAGKTSALLEILHEDKNACLLTFNQSSANLLINRYKQLYPREPNSLYVEDVSKRIFSDVDTVNRAMICTSSLYIDEYFMCKNVGSLEYFGGAVSTMKFPIRIKKLRTFENEVILKMQLSKVQYKMEIASKI